MVTLHTAHTGVFFRKTFSRKLCGSAFLGCGGRPEGRGRGELGQQQGAPPDQPIPPSRAAIRGGGGGGSGGGGGGAAGGDAPAAQALAPADPGWQPPGVAEEALRWRASPCPAACKRSQAEEKE